MTEVPAAELQIVKCPQCGAANSVVNAYCRKCDADMSRKRERIIPMWAAAVAFGVVILFALMAVLEAGWQTGIYVGFIFIVAGALLAIAGNIWFYVNAFRISGMWGVACLVLPLAALFFLIKYPDVGTKPFTLSIAGVMLIAFTGFILMIL